VKRRLEVGGRDANRIADNGTLESLGDSITEARAIDAQRSGDRFVCRVTVIEHGRGRKLAGPSTEIVERQERRA
jgi:hypothetical protein